MTDVEVLIVGAGPAGCGAARLLAAWGHHVRLVERSGDESRSLAESIPPSAQKTLGALGMLTAIEDAGFWPWRGNTVWWADVKPRVESFARGHAGYQVVRGDFDRRLRELASQSGAVVQAGLVREARVSGVTSEVSDRDPSVTIETGGVSQTVTARVVIDASGRAGVLARRTLRRFDPARRTVALVGVWRCHAPWPLDPTHTLVASYADGWAWSVPVAADVRYVTVMVDPERTSLARGVSPGDVYRAELAKVAAFAPLLEASTLTTGPWGADASPYHATRYAGPGFLLAGDAGSFIDPLSSFGVKKALASGWLAAIATHTWLTRPSMGALALEFFDRRERAIAAAAEREAARFAADAAEGSPHPFWHARAAMPEDADLETEVDVAALARAPDVLAAFEDLRTRADVQLRLAPGARIEARPAVRGREIVLDDHLVTPAWPDGVRYLRGLDLVSLVAIAPAHTDVGAMYRAFFDAHPGAGLPDFLGALSVLVARGGLMHGVRS